MTNDFDDLLLPAMNLGRIVETFMIELVENEFVKPCDCCNFPTPTPFFDFESEQLLCRTCRMAHDDEGNHIG